MKNFFKNNEFQLDEIVFSGRNKDYGAYSLRHDSGKILMNATAYGLLFFGAVAALPFLANFLKDKPALVKNPVDDGHRVLVHVDRPDTQPKAQNLPAVHTKTFDSTVPTPTKEPKTEKPAAKIAEYSDAVPAFYKTEGSPTTSVTAHVEVPAIVEPPKISLPKVPDNSIPETVDVEASFNGGINAFRDKVANSFNTADFDGTGETLKTTVTFIVEKDGTISNVKASGSDEKFNQAVVETVRRVKGKWQPAKLGGQNVRSYFRFPVTMQFE